MWKIEITNALGGKASMDVSESDLVDIAQDCADNRHSCSLKEELHEKLFVPLSLAPEREYSVKAEIIIDAVDEEDAREKAEEMVNFSWTIVDVEEY